MNMKAIVLDQAKKGLITVLLAKPIHFVKDLKSVSVSFSYKTKSEPDIIRGKDFTFDVERAKEHVSKFFRIGDEPMGPFKYKIIWINEMGEEEITYAETEADRNSIMQGLADDGYSPVWRDAK